uniref:Reverse transcriptase domain-containing protein n=1 Tax=Anopheles epiroticus TaxID=199890 RepID=A0A182PX12_9DIPT
PLSSDLSRCAHARAAPVLQVRVYTAHIRIFACTKDAFARRSFELERCTTVTYGTACAPFLATRCLLQLSIDEESSFPVAANIIQEDCYVDDILSGASTVAEAIECQTQLLGILHSAGFPPPNPPTKRSVLSEISKLFDPIGLLSPVIIIAKLIMQKIWVAGLPRDTQLEGDILQEWMQFRSSLQHVNNIRIPRCLLYPNHIKVELHGFTDPSKQAFGAALYLRCVYSDASVSLRLICSKSKVAPVKPITTPRMELLGAHLLARLISKVAGSFNLQFSNIILWIDSQIVLTWPTKPPSSLQDLYISTKENPDHVVSRGQLPEALIKNNLRWIGPEFFHHHVYETEILDDLSDDVVPELKTPTVISYYYAHVINSSFRKLKRVVALIQRFILNCQQKDALKRTLIPTFIILELRSAMDLIMKKISMMH